MLRCTQSCKIYCIRHFSILDLPVFCCVPAIDGRIAMMECKRANTHPPVLEQAAHINWISNRGTRSIHHKAFPPPCSTNVVATSIPPFGETCFAKIFTEGILHISPRERANKHKHAPPLVFVHLACFFPIPPTPHHRDSRPSIKPASSSSSRLASFV